MHHTCRRTHRHAQARTRAPFEAHISAPVLGSTATCPEAGWQPASASDVGPPRVPLLVRQPPWQLTVQPASEQTVHRLRPVPGGELLSTARRLL